MILVIECLFDPDPIQKSPAFELDALVKNLLIVSSDDHVDSSLLSAASIWNRQIIHIFRPNALATLPIPNSAQILDVFRSAVLPTNQTHTQRDYFGAHTYRRVDKDGVFPTQWE